METSIEATVTISILIIISLTVQAATPVGRTFRLYLEKKTWKEAEEACRQKNFYLATVYNKSTLPDLGFYTVTEKNSGFRVKEFWIGYSETEQAHTTSIWSWVSGFKRDPQNSKWDAFNVTQFRELKNNPYEFCAKAVLTAETKYMWIQEKCETRLPYLCEYKANRNCEFLYVQDKNVPDDAWRDNENKQKTNSSLEACKAACEKMQGNACLAFEFDTQTLEKRCRYGSRNVWDYEYDTLTDNRHFLYGHRRCNFGIIDGFGPTEPFRDKYERKEFSIGRTFYYHRENVTWSEARSTCRKNGGYLAAVDHISILPDMGFFRSPMLEESFWIGYHRSGNTAQWKWDNGLQSTWENWPDTHQDEDNKDCAMAENKDVSDRFPWEADLCTAHHSFICEKPVGECYFILVPRSKLNLDKSKDKKEDINITECEHLCKTAATFVCYSFNYYQTPGYSECHLYTTNTWISEDERITRDGWTYGHRTCTTGYLDTERTYPFRSVATTTTAKTTTAEMTTETTTTTTTEPTTTMEEPEEPTTTEAITSTSTEPATTPDESIEESTTVTETPPTTKVVCQTIYIQTTEAPAPTTERPKRNTTGEPELVTELKGLTADLKAKRKILTKISVENKEPSAKYVGYMSMGFIFIAVGIVLVADLATLPRDIALMRRRLGFGKKKKFKKQTVIMSNPDKIEANGHVPKTIDIELESGVGNSVDSHEIDVEIFPDEYFEDQIFHTETETIVDNGYIHDGDNSDTSLTHRNKGLNMDDENIDKIAEDAS